MAIAAAIAATGCVGDVLPSGGDGGPGDAGGKDVGASDATDGSSDAGCDVQNDPFN